MAEGSGEMPKAWVVREAQPKARVVHVETNSPAPLPPAEPLPEDVLRSPDAFVRFYRERFGLSPSDPANTADMWKFAQNFGLLPVAILLPAGKAHFVLILKYDGPQNQFIVYDPPRGVRTLPHGSSDRMFYFPDPSKETTARPGTEKAIDLTADHYKIPHERLRALGPTQRTAADCGPLTLYAAAVAKQR